MKEKIYITRQLPDIAKKLLEGANFQVDWPSPDRQLSHSELLQVLKHYDGVLTSIYDKISSDMLLQTTTLSAISNYGIGTDNIDVAFANSHKISVYNVPDIVTNSTADLTWAIFLALVRKILIANSYVQNAKWSCWDPKAFWGQELYGKKLGIIGFGRIGKAVARRALGFGLEVVFSHYRDLDLPPEFAGKIQQVSKEELLASCHYISLHVPLTETTKNMLDRHAFEMMGRCPMIINAARGAVIKTEDLVWALKNQRISGVALDVTDPEPLPSDHPLYTMENCLIVPHIGTATYECRSEMARKAAENLIAHFAAL